MAELGAAAEDGEVLTESKASARLGRRVEGLICQVNKAIDAIKVDDILVEEETLVDDQHTQRLHIPLPVHCVYTITIQHWMSYSDHRGCVSRAVASPPQNPEQS